MSSESAFPVISVVVPTFGRPDETVLAVASLVDLDYPKSRYEIVVVDSSPDDRTRGALSALVGHHADLVRYVKKPVAEGPGASRNFGIAQAKGEILAFTDSDCIVDRDWIARGAAPFGSSPRLGIVQGRTLPNPAHPRGASSRFMQVEEADCVFAACNVFFRKEAFDSVGGYSPDFNLPVLDKPASAGSRLFSRIASFHFNALLGFDVDLAWRVLENGWTSAFAGDAVVYHAVTRLSPMQWLMEGAYYASAGPPMLRRHPQLRRHMYGWLFASRDTALFDLFVLSLILGFGVHWAAFLLAAPYIAHRAAERSRVWRGVLRPFRFLVYLPRDAMTLLFSGISSIRHRTPLV